MYDRIYSFPNREGIFFKDARFICRNLRCPSSGEFIPKDFTTFVKRKDAVTLLTLEKGPVRIIFYE